MNPVIKTQMADYAKSSSLQHLKDDEKFEVYSIFSTLTGFLGESVDAYDVHLSGTEFGVDGVAILIQGELVKNRSDAVEKLSKIKNPSIDFIFFQSKTGTGYDYGDISKFFDAIEEFFVSEEDLESEQLSELAEARRAIYEKNTGKRNPTVSGFFIATGNYDEPKRIETLRSNFIDKLNDLNIFAQDGVSISIVGAKQLQNWYRSATTAVEVEIDFPKNVVMPNNSHVQEAYIGYLSARELAKLYTILDGNGNVIGINKSVFFDNIRDYDEKSKVNLGIKDSVKNDGGKDFSFRNNGITVVSKIIDRTANRFRLEDYQIVNGCQTSHIIYDLLYGPEKNDLEHLNLADNIDIPFRLIGSKDDEFVASIIVGTNRQNPVKEEQFWALRPFMKNFEEYARSVDPEEVIYFERREHQYRGQELDQRVRIVQPSVMMKTLAAAILFQPHRAGRDYRGIISEYEDKLFQDDHDVRVYHASCYLYYRLEFLWRNQRIDSSYKIFRFYLISAVGLLVTSGRDVFGMRKNKIEKVARNIIELSKDEAELKKVVITTSEMIEKLLKGHGISSQDKMRDTIRNESFASEFIEAFKKAIKDKPSKYLVE